MSSRLINKVATRKFILMAANDQSSELPDVYTDTSGRRWDYSRCGKNIKKFTSVSVDFIDELDTEFRRLIVEKLKKYPPRGKTVKT